MPSVGMRIIALLGAVVATAVVSSCAASSPPSDPHATQHNAADVTFARKMIPHHQQALDMAAMVPSRTTNRQLVIMAKHIALDQQAQIETLQGLLQQWGEPAVPDHMGHDDGMGMDGMVDTATMDKLPTLKDAEFDDLWLNSMIIHHEGAVAMAEPEIAQGQNPAAVKMAKIIVEWQQFEIGQMHGMLGPSE
ncbi:hypothetical protein Mycsm_06323 [Mycobacterium sp. JS623]|uniref:DUF305 domain-containing protein n=1 Tax=Mycobacterium sp. JS623 TaxID=212767 RepID=UPI0002A566EF|nr:DUF305 domain-containing protein [Mycobacterium sp. JS623]AGB26476.1 hypothetical protein Mycsm_06323 [Mycobacterium sp. JS623]